MMINKIIKYLVLILLILSLTGCWDYHGVNEVTIVTGMAIDEDEKTNGYKLSFEVISIPESSSSSKQQGTIKTEIIESTGTTIFDAVRNAKKRIMNELYFSNAAIAIVSNQIAKKNGINTIISWFMRDYEIRETLNLIISKEDTAKELLKKNSIGDPMTSLEIMQIIKDDKRVTSSTKNVKLYKIFNAINGNGISLVLPLFHNIENNNEKVIEADGIAVFKKDKLIGNLSSEESKFYLFIENSVNGGILTVDTNNDKTDDISLEIAYSKTTKFFSKNNDKYKVEMKIETYVYIGESMDQSKPITAKKITEIEKKAEKKITDNIEKLILKAKNDYKVDIFSFGNLIYRTNPKLWKKIKKDWEKVFLEIDIDVKTNVKISNTTFMK